MWHNYVKCNACEKSTDFEENIYKKNIYVQKIGWTCNVDWRMVVAYFLFTYNIFNFWTCKNIVFLLRNQNIGAKSGNKSNFFLNTHP
jgi:hypothetical protein